jgi:putative transposase
MDITLRCRAYLNEDVASEAWRHINIHRQIRNHAVRDYYSHAPTNRPSAYDQVNKLPAWKRRWTEWKEVSAHAAQQTVSQIHKDLKTLRKKRKKGYKVGHLRWQGAGEVRSVAYHSEGYNVDHNTGQDGYVTLHLSKIGDLRVRESQPIPKTDDIKRVILKKETTGEWFACFVTDVPKSEKPAIESINRTNSVGVDLGILSYIHTTDNLSVESLDVTDEYDRYVRAQRSLDRKEHGSANWEKQRRKTAKAKRVIKRKVLDFQHKLTTWLVKEYDAVFVEDLDVKPMLETSQSAKNKQDAAWSRFLDLLEYKGDLHGTHVVRVDARGTTKECSRCGVETSKPLWVREHSCPSCGHTEDRDLNAAKNIQNRGLEELFSADIGPGRSESTPVQTALTTFTPVRVNAKRVVEAGSPASPYAG